MSRKISLSRIHAINWFGYNDTLDVHGNLLIAGVTGSGKSVLMDVIQLVLVGDQKAKYNQSATGAASTRNLKSYCLGDTKQDIDGKPQYMRERGSITYVALEFRWPNQKRVETWGLRIEFESSAQNQPNRKEGFFFPKGIGKSGWLNEDRTPMDHKTFHRFVTESGGMMFKTLDSYRREMASPLHLNFDRGVIDYLLPAAMSFTFLRSFNDFCRQYILPRGEVDIQPVSESFQMFRNFERELAILRDQLQQLEAIRSVDRALSASILDRKLYRYAEVELRLDAARDAAENARQREAALEAALDKDARRLKELDARISEDSQRLDSLKAALTATEDGKLFFHLRNRNRELAPQVRQLEAVGNTVEEALRQRVQQSERWLAMASELPMKIHREALDAVAKAAKALPQASGEGIRHGVRDLSLCARELLQIVDHGARDLFAEQGQLDKEKLRLTQLLSALRLGVVPEASVLLDALNQALPDSGRENPARALRELCEVTDEGWRPAVEIAFARKFAVVVEPRDFDMAERIFHGLKQNTPRESLINPSQVLGDGRRRPVRPGSLAEKIETSHPVARAIVDQTLGDLMCVEAVSELRQHNRAIMRDGFMYQRPFVERRAHYQNNPCVGSRGIEQQRKFLQSQLDEVTLSQRILSPKVQAVRDFLDFARASRLDSESVHDDLAALSRLAELRREMEQNIETMRQIRDLGMDEKEQEIAELESRRAQDSRERDQLMKNQTQADLQLARQERKSREAAVVAAEDNFRRFQVEGLVNLDEYRERYDELLAALLAEWPLKEQAAESARNRYHEADKSAIAQRQELLTLRRELARVHTGFLEIDPESESNAIYDARLEKIEAGDIPSYEEKARRERTNWQHLFRTQVLAKLHAALFEVESLLAVLNQELRSPIGHNLYQIARRPNPDAEYKIYRELVDASAAAREDDLFFESMDGDLRRTVEEIFSKLVDQPESKEALSFLDYRNYHDYDMLVTDTRTENARPSSVDRHSGKFSGGENQSPYFIAILACYLRAYHRYERRRRDPSLALVPIDEAFSKLSGERIRNCINALQTLDLQGVFSMSSGNIPYAMDMCDQFVTIMKQERQIGRRVAIRNLPASMTREEAVERYGSNA
ncbi:MAG TPA: SbcC/MukB-like Walker B domain-containing protein [Chthoniobacteraceae bacterium]|nr:SbcC/MukB-like Walker B domain-containing protein [Chthoniobacteraceae bacterium]